MPHTSPLLHLIASGHCCSTAVAEYDAYARLKTAYLHRKPTPFSCPVFPLRDAGRVGIRCAHIPNRQTECVLSVPGVTTQTDENKTRATERENAVFCLRCLSCTNEDAGGETNETVK